MKLTDINIRDPYVLCENNTYYLYGTRAKNFGQKTSGFDVYKSTDLVNWSEPTECFNSQKYNMNTQVNWAPEVHKYNGRFYMFATFTKENGLRGTYILSSDSPAGPFTPYSNGAVTPYDWECLDGTLYIDKAGIPYLVFCHEHTQIIDGTICYIRLRKDLKAPLGKPKLIFRGSEPYYIEKKPDGEHYITDGPFLYCTKEDKLIMIWSTFIDGKYAQCMAESDSGEIDGKFIHLEPLITNDGGHGMVFQTSDSFYLTYHTPNKTDYERPVFRKIQDNGDKIELLD